VSVIELPGQSTGADRTPPQDIGAEQSVLGGMLLSKDAIADVVEALRGSDFYRPAHQIIFDVVCDLYGRGEPADPITVAAELTKHGTLARVGGAAYLHTLMSSVPTAANAGYYARIVADKAILRRLVEAGTRIVQLGYAGSGGEVDEIVDRAQAAIYDVTERRTTEDYAILESLLQPTMDEIEASGQRGAGLTGVPTGFADLDALTNGLHPGQLVVIAGRPAMGKALALDTPLPTPTGWTTMGRVGVGEALLGADGRPTRVIAATEVMVGRPCFRVEFDDGSAIVADAQHQWLTEEMSGVLAGVGARCRAGGYLPERHRVAGRAGVRTTAELAAVLGGPHGSAAYVANTVPLELPTRRLPLPPYLLGRLLAAGRSWAGMPHIPVIDLAAPNIPAAYLRASIAQRRALLAGIVEGAGTVTPTGAVRVTCRSRRLADDVRELAASLGSSASFAAAWPRAAGRGGSRVQVVLRLGDRTARRRVVAIRRVESVPVRCVQVDNEAHLYLAGRGMIPTHNSTLGLDVARATSIKHQQTSVLFSLEMSKHEITMRLLSAEARIPLQVMRTGQMRDDDWVKLTRRLGEMASAPLYIDDSPNLTMMEIRAKARRLKQRHDLRLLIVDYLQLMTSHTRVENRQQEVSQISRSLKLLAKELEVPVIALSQLNRGPEQRNDKKPQLSDLRECLAGDTVIVRRDTGERVAIRDLEGRKDVPIWSVDDRFRLVPAVMSDVWRTGTREVFRLTLASGRTITATGNHPLRTLAGWTPVEQLRVDDHLATARALAAPESPAAWPDSHVVMLAHLLGDGCVSRAPVYYCSRDEACLGAVEEAAEAFCVDTTRSPGRGVTYVHFPMREAPARGRTSPLYDWLRELDLYGKRAPSKRVPAAIHSLGDRQIKLFLRHLWATDGSVTVARNGRVRVFYATTSRALADDVQALLLRLGIGARLRRAGSRTAFPVWSVDVSGRDDLISFLTTVGVHGERGERCKEALAALQDKASNTNVDVIPRDAWDYVRKAMGAANVTTRHLAQLLNMSYCGAALYKSGLSRARMARVAAALPDPFLVDLATSDVRWDRITSIERAGREDVYDAHVPGVHSFLANEVVSHNSGAIEQDADVVILLHREDVYERESPRAGEADLIVAKHRNGPTSTIVVAFQGHYSRFVDMAAGWLLTP
jgi:replicative DNA helicase